MRRPERATEHYRRVGISDARWNTRLRRVKPVEVEERLQLATVTLLHWNIEQFSNTKLNNKNGAALINYIATVVAKSKANIISLLELKNSAVDSILAKLVPAINLANGVAPTTANQWQPLIVDTGFNNEAYVVLYQLGNNFKPVTPAAGGSTIICGLTNETLLDDGKPGGTLNFNSRLTNKGGRKPYYVAFKTEDTENYFSIVACHLMFGLHSGAGLRSVGKVAQSRAILDAGVKVNMSTSFTSGDFNVNFDPDSAGDYYNVLQLPSTQSTNEKTALVKETPEGGYPTPAQYRTNAYDNIFKYNSILAPPAGGGVVPDLIYESTLPKGKGSGVLSRQAEAFVRDDIKNGRAIQHIPPEDFEDAWHIVRTAISDHLPVYVSLKI